MLSYKKRKPLSPDTQVWHYTTLDAVIAIWRDQQMRLTRIDNFTDPFEGSVTKQDIDNQVPLFSGHNMLTMSMQQSIARSAGAKSTYRDLWGEMTKRRRAKTRSAHAIGWRWGDDSEAMWRLYCSGGDNEKQLGQGLALRSSLEKLEKSVEHEDVYLSPLNYRFYHEGDAFDDELDAFMHKRMGFIHEQEVRVLMFDIKHYHLLCAAIVDDSETLPADLPKYRFIDWSPTACVDAIVISPYASKEYESEARSAIVNLDPKFPVELSVLSERRYAPQF